MVEALQGRQMESRILDYLLHFSRALSGLMLEHIPRSKAARRTVETCCSTSRTVADHVADSPIYIRPRTPF